MACPICQKETSTRYRPFCSKRCADIDLGHWLAGDYSTPAHDAESLQDAAEEVAQQPRRPH